MEVHHHPQVKEKKFKEYFLEFIMIFLAVTLGFFAENLREVISENKTTKELAVSLYSDLKKDTSELNSIVASRSEKEKAMSQLLALLEQNPEKINASVFFSLVKPAFSSTDFDQQRSTGTISQLKNAGYLRFYTHTGIPRALAAYESSANALSEMEKMESRQITDKGYSFLTEEIDPALFDAGYADNDAGIPANIQISPVHPGAFRMLAGNCVVIKILNRNISRHYLIDAKEKAVALMKILEKNMD